MTSDNVPQSLQLKLRAVEPSDADFMYEIENDASAWRYGDTIAPLSRRIIRQYALDYEADPFAARQLRLIVTVKQENSMVPVGAVDLYEIDPVHRRAFVGIYILPAYRGCGIAQAALTDLENYACKVLRFRMLAAKVESDNKSSLSLFERCGFKVSAILPEWFATTDGQFTDLNLMTKVVSR